MPRVGRRDREEFTGWIAGLGTASGHRVVIGHWPRPPYGVVTDAMVQDPAGRRTLYAPTLQVAEFLAAAYRFDEVRVVPLPRPAPSLASPYWQIVRAPSHGLRGIASTAGCHIRANDGTGENEGVNDGYKDGQK
jgi:hypothetical protein